MKFTTSYPGRLTPWFPGGVKPARPGVYLRDGLWLTPAFAKYENGKWFMAHQSPHLADIEQQHSRNQTQAPWRGLMP